MKVRPMEATGGQGMDMVGGWVRCEGRKRERGATRAAATAAVGVSFAGDRSVVMLQRTHTMHAMAA